MSSTLIYNQVAVMFPATVTGFSEDLYAVCTQSGDSNCYEGWGANARRSRSWGCYHFGTAAQVIHQAIHDAAYFEGGGIKLFGSNVLPERYITSIRNLLTKAQKERCDMTNGYVPYKNGGISFKFMHPVKPGDGMGPPHVKTFHASEIKELIDMLRDEAFMAWTQTVQPWAFCKVSGPDPR